MARCPQLDAVHRHVRAFAQMLCNLQGENLTAWIDAVGADDLPVLHSFAANLHNDRDASVEEDVVTSEALARYSDPITSTPPRATALSWTETQAELRSSGEVIGRNPDTFFTPPSDWTPDETAAILDPDGEPEVPAEEAVLGHWSFDEGAGTTTTDSSEWSNTANLNDTARWTPGKSGTALTNATSAPPATAKSSAAPPSRLGAAAAAPTLSGFTVNPSQTVNGTIVTSSLTPTLKVTATDAATAASTVEFRVLKYSDDSLVWSGSVANVPSGTQASITVPAAKLVDGTRYEWQVRATSAGGTSAWSAYQYFTADVPEAVVDQFQVTPSETVGTATVTPSLTPALLASVTDPLGGAATVEFQVADWATDTVFWSTSVTGVASGAQASVTVPSGRLSDKVDYEFRVKATTSGSTPVWSNWQRFRIDLFDPATDPAVSQLQVIPSQNQGGVTTASSVTPELRALVSHPQGSASRVEFEVEHDPSAPQGQGSGQIWSTALDNVPSGTAAAVAVPADKLADGWLVRWRLRFLVGGSSSTWSAWQQVKVAVPKPGVGQFQVTPSQVVDGKTVTTVTTPSLHAQVTYALGGTLRAEFEVEHDPAAPTGQGSGQIWTGGVDNVAPGSQAALAVPDGKLSDGWVVRWRARATSATAASGWSSWQKATVEIPKPGVGLLQVTPSQEVDGKTVTSILTPSLHARVTYAPGGALRAEFEVEHDPAAPENQGSGQIWAGSVHGIAVNSRAVLAVPSGKLTDGWQVRWRARAVAGGVSAGWSSWLTVKADLILPGEEPLAEATTALVPSESSFTVGAWVRWADKDGDYTVIEQRGTHQAAFRLGNTVEDGLVFTFASADTREASTGGVLSQVEPPVNQWFHLAGAYDAATKRATLYLNGVAIESATLGFTTWRADGVTTLGTRLNGSLDDIWIYDKTITAEEAAVAAGVTASAARVKSSVKAAAAASATPTYHRIAPADCIKENSSFCFPPRFPVPVRNPKGWNPGPHDWCVSQKPKFTVEVTDPRTLRSRVTDEASMVLMTIGRVFNDSRTAEIEVINLQLDDTVQGSVFDGQVFALGLDVQGSPASSCRQVVDSSHLSVYAGNESYWNNRTVAFKIESPESGWTPADTSQWLSECTIQLKLTVRDLPLMYKGAMAKGVVRCDSARENQLFPRGCIFDHKMRAVELHENTLPDAYAHIYKAYKTPNLTTPETTTTNPRLWPKHVPFGTGKEFPGFSTDTPLTRLNKKDSDPNVIKNRASRNYYRSFRICAIDYKSSWKGGAAPWDTSLKECDEYPFQSTYQGSWVSWQANKPADKGAPYKPGVAVSVSLILKQQNTNWGATYHLARLGRFYMNDRILYKENFILHLYNAAGNLVNPGP